MSTFLTTLSLLGAPQAVVFDFGGVMTGEPNKEAVVQFLRSTFALSEAEFEKINLEKREAVKAGKSDEEFWLQFAKKNDITLPADWLSAFKAVMKEAIGVNPEMYVLVAELKAKQIPVALLSNIDMRLAKLIREFGLYEPFEPCLLSCEIGAEKPDPKAYQALLDELNLSTAKEVIFIDDRQENIDAALMLGFDAVLFTSVELLRQELDKKGCYSQSKRSSSAPFDFTSLEQQLNSPPLNQFHARDGAPLSYRFYESKNQENAIILIHGSGAHGEYLHPLAEYLAGSELGQVYVPNLRGHYLSGNTRGDCAYIGQLEDDLCDYINHFNLQQKNIFLVGHSSGGGLAIRFANGHFSELIKGFILLSPAIPTAPTMRNGNAGGWANVSVFKIILLSFLNKMHIRNFNHLYVISFNKPQEYCDGKDTLAYSYNLNCSYHPRIPYEKDIAALKGRSLVIVGSDDEANDPSQYPKVMADPKSEFICITDGVGHLNIVCNRNVFSVIRNWISNKTI